MILPILSSGSTRGEHELGNGAMSLAGGASRASPGYGLLASVLSNGAGAGTALGPETWTYLDCPR